MSLSWVSTLLTTIVLVGASGCSALVTPDTTRLDLIDGSITAFDARPPFDRVPTDVVIVLPDVISADVPTCSAPCDDRVTCTADRCVGSTCTFSPDSTRCASGELCDPQRGCIAGRCRNNTDCDDGNACNGRERCDSAAAGNGCVAGTPLRCDDSASCTRDSCEASEGCVFEPTHAMCADRFACTRELCAPTMPNADARGCIVSTDDTACDFCRGEVCRVATGCTLMSPPTCGDGNSCTADRCDISMNACVHPPLDFDMDGFPARSVDGRMCPRGTDCDDRVNSIFPGAPERCGDGIDQDCNGSDLPCPAQMGETCANAIRINAAGTAFFVSGNTNGFVDDHDSTCSPDGSRDIVYSVDVPAGSDLELWTTGSADTVISAFSSCPRTATVFACNNNISSRDENSRLWLRLGRLTLPSNRIFISVETVGGTGPFTLNGRVTPSLASSCSRRSDVGLDMSLGGTVYSAGATVGSGVSGSCGGLTTGEDIFVATAERRTSIQLVGTSGAPITIYVRQEQCGFGPEGSCATSSMLPIAGLRTARIGPLRVQAGETLYFIGDTSSEFSFSYDPQAE